MTEFLGHDAFLGPHADHSHEAASNEVWLRMAVRARERRTAEAFPRLFPWLGLSGPPYLSGFHGVTPPSQLLGVWPALVSRAEVEPQVDLSPLPPGEGPGARAAP